MSKNIEEIKKRLESEKIKKSKQHEAKNFNNQTYHEGWISALKWVLGIE